MYFMTNQFATFPVKAKSVVAIASLKPNAQKIKIALMSIKITFPTLKNFSIILIVAPLYYIILFVF